MVSLLVLDLYLFEEYWFRGDIFYKFVGCINCTEDVL